VYKRQILKVEKSHDKKLDYDILNLPNKSLQLYLMGL